MFIVYSVYGGHTTRVTACACMWFRIQSYVLVFTCAWRHTYSIICVVDTHIILLLVIFFHSRISWWYFIIFWVSSGIQDSPEYSGRLCDLNGLISSSDFQLFQSPFQSFGDRSNSTHYNWYHHHSQILELFLVLWQGLSICLSFRFLLFTIEGPLER